MRALGHTYELCQGWGELQHMCGVVLDGVNNVMNLALKLTVFYFTCNG